MDDRHAALRSFPSQNKQLRLGAVGREQRTDKLGAFFDGTLCLIYFICALRIGQTCCVHQREAEKSNPRVVLIESCAVCVHHTTCTLERNTLMRRVLSFLLRFCGWRGTSGERGNETAAVRRRVRESVP